MKDKKNTLYIVVIQICASFHWSMLKHKKDVDSKDVDDTKKCIYYKWLFDNYLHVDHL